MNQPTLILGSAMWGWTIEKERAFLLLDRFYEAGFREVDGATNYPINKVPADFRKAENILLEWINAHGIDDLKVMMKVGSINNMRSPIHNLTKSFLLLNLDDYQYRFGKNLETYMIHWDNRASGEKIKESLDVFQVARDQGLRVGFSGIKHPELYTEANKAFGLDFRIQIKHNLLKSDYNRYPTFHGKRQFITYGINAGGLKLNPKDYRVDSSLKTRGGDIESIPEIVFNLKENIDGVNEVSNRVNLTNFNHCGLTFAYLHPDIQGILLGVSRMEQLEDSLQFYKALQTYDYQDVYQLLSKLHQEYAAA